MDNIINYLKYCVNPNNQSEFMILDTFDQNVFDSMKQDGILIIKNGLNIDSSIDYVIINNFMLCRKNKPRQIEWLNEDNTFSFTLSREPIYRRLIPPPWETIDHPLLICNIIKETNGEDKTYIEYGVRSGECIEKVSKYVKNAYGVDINPYNNANSNIIMSCMTTDAFSEKTLPSIKYDYVFIDADHSSKQVFIDFENVYKYLNSGGYIFLHDTYPCMIENLSPNACNDCYLSPILIKNKYPSIEMLTLPFNPGFTIIRKN